LNQSTLPDLLNEIDAFLNRNDVIDALWETTSALETSILDLSPAEQPSIVADLWRIGMFALEGGYDPDVEDAEIAEDLSQVHFIGFERAIPDDAWPLDGSFSRLVRALRTQDSSEVKRIAAWVLNEAESLRRLRAGAFKLYGRLRASVMREWPGIAEPTWTR
jgi:hypothetical protein